MTTPMDADTLREAAKLTEQVRQLEKELAAENAELERQKEQLETAQRKSDLRQTIEKLRVEVNTLKGQKTQLEKEIECAIEETKRNNRLAEDIKNRRNVVSMDAFELIRDTHTQIYGTLSAVQQQLDDMHIKELQRGIPDVTPQSRYDFLLQEINCIQQENAQLEQMCNEIESEYYCD